jgi:hypothetical protein
MDALIVLGEVAAADAEHEARSRIAEALRMPQYLSDPFTYPAARALLVGNFAEAQRLADRTLEAADPIYTETTMTLFGAQVICLHWLRGQLDGLLPMVRDFAERFPWIPTFRAAEAFVLAETGQHAEADAILDELGADGFAVVPRDGIWSVAMWVLASAAARTGNRRAAEQLYELLLPVADYAIGLGASMYLGPTRTPLGMLAAALGDAAAAADHLEAAVADLRALGARPFLAYALFWQAGVLRRRSQPGDLEHAIACETEAARIATDLGMDALAGDLRAIH